MNAATPINTSDKRSFTTSALKLEIQVISEILGFTLILTWLIARKDLMYIFAVNVSNHT